LAPGARLCPAVLLADAAYLIAACAGVALIGLACIFMQRAELWQRSFTVVYDQLHTLLAAVTGCLASGSGGVSGHIDEFDLALRNHARQTPTLVSPGR
jgi:hypothetical protein